MTPKRLSLLLLVLTLLAPGLAWKVFAPSAPSPPSEPDAKLDTLLPGDPSALKMLRIERPRYGQRVAFTLEQGHWQMKEPLLDEADDFAVSTALDVLFGQDYRPPLPLYLAQTEAQLGLDQPEVVVEVIWKDGSTSDLRIGAQEVGGDFRVCARPGGLVRLPIPSYRRLSRAVEDWRSHRLQPFGMNLTEVVWAPTDGQALRFRNEGRHWRLVEPVEARMSEPAEDQLKSLIGARLIGMGLETYDFDDPKEVLGILTLKRGDDSVRLKFSQDLGVISDRRAYSLTVDPHQIRVLSLPLDRLVSPKLLDLDADRIASIEVWQGEDHAYFRRAGGAWANAAGEALDEAAASFLDALLRYGQGLERQGEAQARPSDEAAGHILFSISLRPLEKGGVQLWWWVDADGKLWVSDGRRQEVYPSNINFEAGVRDFFAQLKG